MHLYSVYENGAIRKVKKATFTDNKVYLIDDVKIIYLWTGLKVSKKKKDYGKKRANDLNRKRENSAEIQELIQNQEYGSFLAIMELLKKGIIEDLSESRRPELEIEIGDTMELIQAGLEPDFEAEVSINAYNLSHQKRSYEDLCRDLAELQLSIIKGKKKATEQEIKKKKDDIFKSSSTYDELCWLIAELKALTEKKELRNK